MKATCRNVWKVDPVLGNLSRGGVAEYWLKRILTENAHFARKREVLQTASTIRTRRIIPQ